MGSTGILATKMKNLVKNAGGERFEFHVKNVRVNQRTYGCSGFIVNPDNGRIVYITTDDTGTGVIARRGDAMFRRAASLTDYTGERNQYGDAHDIVSELTSAH